MLEAGDRIGDWVVERALGAGGMGAVFRCHNALTPRITAAVKLIGTDPGGEARERFLREVEALDQLHHPAIVRVKGWGEDPARSAVWLAMDLVEGEDLARRLERGALSEAEAEALLRALADGLGHAHRAGVFHRDIKPANIVLPPGGGALLVDFGIAVASDRTRMTQAELVVGTPLYMPPEVFDQHPEPRLVDVYALGQVLCEALTGRPAFATPKGMTSGVALANLMGQKTNAGPLDPGSGAPERLRALVRAMTAPDPRERLPTMEAAVALLDATPTAAVPPPRRGLLWAGLAGVAAVIAVGGAGWLLLPPVDPPPKASDAGRDLADPTGSERLAQAPPEAPAPDEPEEPAAEPAAEPEAPVGEPPPAATPTTTPPVAEAPKPTPGAAPWCGGATVLVLHRADQEDAAARAVSALNAAGCTARAQEGQEGPMWEPFWGHVYYFDREQDELAAKASRAAARKGLKTPEYAADRSDDAVVIWLNGA